jgi:nicotinamide riboside kinase
MKITKGKQHRAQRVVIYGVESVGKSTFAAQFPKPLFLDVEGGTAHLDTDRAEINSAIELDEALTA